MSPPPLQANLPLQQTTWPGRPTRYAPLPPWAPPSVTAISRL